MGTCDAGHGCSKSCDGGCGCVYVHSTGTCTCQCFTTKTPEKNKEITKIRPDELVDVSMTDISIIDAIKFLKKFID